MTLHLTYCFYLLILDCPLLLSNSLANGNYMTDEEVFIKDSDYRSNETTTDISKEV